MTRNQLEGLARNMPHDDPYFRAIGHSDRFFVHHQARTDAVLEDPSFGANVARRNAQAGLELAQADWPESVRRAHEFWSGPTEDQSMLEAEVWSLPESFDYRTVISALGLCENSTHSMIADLLDSDREAPLLFHELFFNVQTRLDEPLYRLRLLELIRREGERLRQPQRTGWALELFQLAMKTRRAEDILDAASLLIKPATVEELSAQIREQLTQVAIQKGFSELGGAAQNRALALAIKHRLLPRVERHTDSRLGFQLGPRDLAPLHDDLSQRLALNLPAPQPQNASVTQSQP